MYKDEENAMVAFRRDTLPFDAIPLYTHPVKELTDEEITKLHLECWDEIEFARAILRKAQEKC
jgi:hypothetical protein